MIRGVLFDMDGVLLDTERLSRTIIFAYCESIGHPIDDGFFRKLMGLTVKAAEALFCKEVAADFPYDEYLKHYHGRLREELYAGRMPRKPGLVECFRGLKERGIRIALASSTSRDRVEEYIRYIPEMQNVFDAMVLGTEAGASKPDPAIYLEAARRIGIPSNECVGVEDSRAGIMSIRASGSFSVMIPDMLPYSEDLAPYVDEKLDSLFDLCPLIDRLNENR